jgi:phage-related protein
MSKSKTASQINTHQIQPQLFSPWHPDRLNRKQPVIIEDLLALIEQSKIICVRKMIDMLRDLRDHGLDSRYSKHLFDAVYELKNRTSDGGARVYFIHGSNNHYFMVHAECKKETQASEWMLAHCLEILEALEQRTPLFPKGQLPKQFLTRKENT